MTTTKLTERPSLLLLVALLMFPQISETIYTPSLPDIANDLWVSVGEAEFTLSIYFIGFAVGVFAWGALADRWGRRPTMLLGLVIYLLSTLACGLAPSMTALLGGRFLQALGASVGSVVTQTMIRDAFTGAELRRVFAVAGAALSISPALGPLLGGWVDATGGWRACFALLLGMVSLLSVWAVQRLPETKAAGVGAQGERPRLWPLAKRMLRDGHVRQYALVIALCNGILFSYYGEAPYLFIDLMQLSPPSYGWLGFLVATALLLGARVYHRLAGHAQGVVTQLGAASALAGALWWVLSVAWGCCAPGMELGQWIMLLAPMGLVFFGVGLLIPHAISNALVGYQKELGTAASLLGASYYTMIALLTAGMSCLHNGSGMALPVYIAGMSLAMLALPFASRVRTPYGKHASVSS